MALKESLTRFRCTLQERGRTALHMNVYENVNPRQRFFWKLPRVSIFLSAGWIAPRAAQGEYQAQCLPRARPPRRHVAAPRPLAATNPLAHLRRAPRTGQQARPKAPKSQKATLRATQRATRRPSQPPRATRRPSQRTPVVTSRRAHPTARSRRATRLAAPTRPRQCQHLQTRRRPRRAAPPRRARPLLRPVKASLPLRVVGPLSSGRRLAAQSPSSSTWMRTSITARRTRMPRQRPRRIRRRRPQTRWRGPPLSGSSRCKISRAASRRHSAWTRTNKYSKASKRSSTCARSTRRRRSSSGSRMAVWWRSSSRLSGPRSRSSRTAPLPPPSLRPSGRPSALAACSSAVCRNSSRASSRASAHPTRRSSRR